jgi:hypothetical protein
VLVIRTQTRAVIGPQEQIVAINREQAPMTAQTVVLGVVGKVCLVDLHQIPIKALAKAKTMIMVGTVIMM